MLTVVQRENTTNQHSQNETNKNPTKTTRVKRHRSHKSQTSRRSHNKKQKNCPPNTKCGISVRLHIGAEVVELQTASHLSWSGPYRNYPAFLVREQPLPSPSRHLETSKVLQRFPRNPNPPASQPWLVSSVFAASCYSRPPQLHGYGEKQVLDRMREDWKLRVGRSGQTSPHNRATPTLQLLRLPGSRKN